MIKKKVYVLDSSALIAYFDNEQCADIIENLLNKFHNREIELLLPVIQLGEIAYVSELKLGQSQKEKVLMLIKSIKIKFIDIDSELSLIAADFKAQGGIAYPDCFVIAVALRYKAIIVTKDCEFKKFDNKVELELLL